MKLSFYIKAAVLGFLATSLGFAFFMLAKPSGSNLRRFFLLKIDTDSATEEFFQKLQTIYPHAVTAESLSEVPLFENNTALNAQYFTPYRNYERWFFTEAGFENMYLPKNKSPLKYLKLHALVSQNTHSFYIEAQTFANFFSLAAALTFFIVLLLCSKKKLLLAIYSAPFLLCSFFCRSFILSASLLMIQTGIYCMLALDTTDRFKEKENDARFLVISFALTLGGALLSLFNPANTAVLFFISFGLFLCAVFFVHDIQVLHRGQTCRSAAECTETTGDIQDAVRILGSANTTKKTCEHNKAEQFFCSAHAKFVSLVAVLLLSILFLFFYFFKSTSPALAASSPLYALTLDKKARSFSAESFFKIENDAQQEEFASLNSFVRDCYANIALEYSRVGSTAPLENGATIYYNDFVFSDGKLLEIPRRILECNDSFIADCLLLARDHFPNSIYSVMRAEGAFGHFTVKKIVADYEADIFQIASFLGYLVILALINFYKKPATWKDLRTV